MFYFTKVVSQRKPSTCFLNPILTFLKKVFKGFFFTIANDSLSPALQTALAQPFLKKNDPNNYGAVSKCAIFKILENSFFSF